MILPQAKTENIVVQELKDELLVYNLTTHQAFQLNETLKVVYEACDGETPIDELKREHQLTDDFVHFALDKLAAHNLLTDYRAGEHFAGMSRRAVIKRVGLGSLIALPIISTLVAPSAAHAASGAAFARGTPCTSTAQCQAGDTCKSTATATQFGSTIVLNNSLLTQCCMPSGSGTTNGSSVVTSAGTCSGFFANNCCSGRATGGGTPPAPCSCTP